MPAKSANSSAICGKQASHSGRQKGSHHQFKHESFKSVITLSGAEGDDAKSYQERQIAIAQSKAAE
jgi:hypothetical protein